jgi:hypothetical protein
MKPPKDENSMLIIPKNPYQEPISRFIYELTITKWLFPYIPQVIHSIVIFVIILILIILYATIGIISQISSIFWNLIVQTGQKIKIEYPIEGSAYGIAIGIYFTLFLPFFLVQFPFWLLGWFISKIGFRSFVFTMFVIMSVLIAYYLSPSFQSKIKNLTKRSDSTNTKIISIDTLKPDQPLIIPKKKTHGYRYKENKTYEASEK